MKQVWYNVIVILPTLVTFFGPLIALYIMGYRGKRLRRLVATYAFSRIIKTKTDDRGETRWLFKGMDLTNEEELLPQVLTSLFYLFLVFFSGVVSIFYQLLLLDVNYRCEGNEKTQDCFKLSFFESSIREPIDCNSAAVQNGTIDVVCYKIVFNFGLAVGASYGGFQLSMVFLNMATSAMLMAKQAKTIRNIRIVLGLLSLCLFAALMAVQFTSPQLFITDNLVITLQGIVSVVSMACFVFGIPWKELIAFKAADNNTATSLRPLRAGSHLISIASEEQRSPEWGLPNPAADAI